MLQKTGSPKVASILLLIGGVFQILAGALHVAMFFGISKAPASDLPAAIKPLLHIFNAAVLVTVLFFAYVSFFRRKDLIQTALGRAICLFIGVFYMQRALVEVAVRGVALTSLGLLSLIAVLYFLAVFTPHRAGSRAIEGAALGVTPSN
jgi:hypothetical membrane protein